MSLFSRLSIRLGFSCLGWRGGRSCTSLFFLCFLASSCSCFRCLVGLLLSWDISFLFFSCRRFFCSWSLLLPSLLVICSSYRLFLRTCWLGCRRHILLLSFTLLWFLRSGLWLSFLFRFRLFLRFVSLFRFSLFFWLGLFPVSFSRRLRCSILGGRRCRRPLQSAQLAQDALNHC